MDDESVRRAIAWSSVRPICGAGFGMGRMTELKTKLGNPRATIRPFRAYAEAVRWLTMVSP